MRILNVLLFSFLFISQLQAQTANEYFEKKDFQALSKLEKKADSLTAQELYLVGFAFFQLENDPKAIEFYDLALAKGFESSEVHFYKGLSWRYLKKYDKALKEIEIAIKMDPDNQEYMNEKGIVFYKQRKLNDALTVFEAAKLLPKTFPEPYYWTARIYYEQQKFEKALEGFYETLTHLPKSNSNYVEALICIGDLEFSFTKEYLKSAKAYSDAIILQPTNYELYYSLIKAYNAAHEYVKSDSVFSIVRMVYEEGKLPKEELEIKSIAVAQFEWNGQNAVINRSFLEPKQLLDISYKVFLIDKNGEKVERRFLIEKSISIEKDGVMHLLCEQDKVKKVHITYPYGWTTDNIPTHEIEKAVKLVLDGKMKASATSDN